MTVVELVPEANMPQLFQAADQASLEAQASYVGGTRKRLLILAGAAVAGVCSWRVGSGRVDVWGIAGVIAFVAAMTLELSAWRSRPDKAWYDGRAVAESAKTLAWKFAVGALPFPSDMNLSDARHALLKRFQEVRDSFPGLELAASEAPAISDWMIDQRMSPLEHRRSSYLSARIADQRGWYSRNTALNKKKARFWRSTLVASEFLGVAFSLAAALVENFMVISPAIATIVVAIVAWSETKQYDFNARAYSAAVSDLANAEEKLKLAADESTWAREVDDAEEAISREHVVWWATRSRI
jgi:hypothetical protein